VKRRALSLLEVVVCLALLGMLLAVAFLAFERGSRSWRRIDKSRDVIEGARLLAQDLEQEIQRSSYSSLATEGESISFLSALNDSGQFALDVQGRPLWQRYLIYYRQASTQELIRCDQPLAGATDISQTLPAALGAPISTFWGPGRRLATYVRRLTCKWTPARSGSTTGCSVANRPWARNRQLPLA